MKIRAYYGVAKYTIAGFLLGTAIVAAGFFLNQDQGYTGAFQDTTRYSPDFIIILLSPFYLSLFFGAFALRKKRLIVAHDTNSQNLLTLFKEVANYKFALDQSAIVIIFDTDGRIVHVNSKFCEINQLREAELLGKNYRSFSISLRDQNLIKPIWETLLKGKTWKGELENRNIKGKTYWADTTIVPLLDGNGNAYRFLTMQQDISERKKLEHELVESNGRLQQAMHIAKLGSWELDKDNNLTISAELRKLHGFSAKRNIALREVIKYIHPDDLAKVHQGLTQCKMHRQKVEVEYRFLAGGTESFMISNMNPKLNEAGEYTGCFGTAQDITADKLAELALKKSEEEKAVVLNNTQTIICLHDMDGRLIDINPAGEKASGFTKQEVMGLNLKLIITPEFQPAFEAYLHEIHIKDQLSGTLQIFNKAGTKRVWHYHNTVYANESGKKYVIASAIDITESVKAQNEIERQQHIIRQIIDNSPNVIFMLNEEREIMLGNRAFANYYPYKISDTPLAASLSRGAGDMFLNDLPALFEMKDGGASQKEGSIMNPLTGTVSWFSIIHKCFTDKKGKKFILCYGMDVTKRHQIEADLTAANQLVEKSLKVKDQFIANMSHEIRTPLNAVIGFTDLLSETSLDDRQTEFLDIVKTASANLLGLINNVLDLSKIESSNLILESVPLKLKKNITDVVKILEPKAKNKGLQVNITYDDSLPEYVMGDQLRLNQVLFNLISNSIKFTDTGSIDITCEEKSGPDSSKIYVGLSVKDTGIGIPKDKQAQIFERFAQANTNTQRLYGGTGLGLSITQSIVELFQGTISVESEYGEGATFYIVLPFNKFGDRKVNAQISKAEKESYEELKLSSPIHILLAEDNMVNAMLATEVLTKKGFTLRHVVNGALAVESAQKEHFDLILMDIQMPVMNGIDASVAIRKLTGPVSEIPIIAMTAHSLHGEMKNCFKNGMNGYVAKPFKANDLFDSILDLVKKKDAAAGKMSSDLKPSKN